MKSSLIIKLFITLGITSENPPVFFEIPPSPISLKMLQDDPITAPASSSEAVFTWSGLEKGDIGSLSLVCSQKLSESEQRSAAKTIENLASQGHFFAQEILVQCWIDGHLGLRLTQANQKNRLTRLWEFCQTNPLVHKYLIESYITGDFGICPTKKANKRKAQKFALSHLDSPGVCDLVIQAMRQQHLGFKSKRDYYVHRKVKKKWVRIEDKHDLRLIEYLAEKRHPRAQVFLIECYIDNRYGADNSDKKAFSNALNRMEELNDNNYDLEVLILLAWRLNLLRYDKKHSREYQNELSRLTKKFGHEIDQKPEFLEYNQFKILSEKDD